MNITNGGNSNFFLSPKFSASKGLVFTHHAYTTAKSVAFKTKFYGYRNDQKGKSNFDYEGGRRNETLYTKKILSPVDKWKLLQNEFKDDGTFKIKNLKESFYENIFPGYNVMTGGRVMGQ